MTEALTIAALEALLKAKNLDGFQITDENPEWEEALSDLEGQRDRGALLAWIRYLRDAEVESVTLEKFQELSSDVRYRGAWSTTAEFFRSEFFSILDSEEAAGAGKIADYVDWDAWADSEGASAEYFDVPEYEGGPIHFFYDLAQEL